MSKKVVWKIEYISDTSNFNNILVILKDHQYIKVKLKPYASTLEVVSEINRIINKFEE